jgi:hypothetical protein
VRMSPWRTGPLTLRTMVRSLSSRNSTRTCAREKGGVGDAAGGRKRVSGPARRGGGGERRAGRAGGAARARLGPPAARSASPASRAPLERPVRPHLRHVAGVARAAQHLDHLRELDGDVHGGRLWEWARGFLLRHAHALSPRFFHTEVCRELLKKKAATRTLTVEERRTEELKESCV